MNKNTFDTEKYIAELGRELVSEFEKSGMGTHSQAVGTGREFSVKNKLKNILPVGIGVGSGFVIDSYGNVSQQCDIIIYEENFAMKFALNDDESNTYYNCESVIAVGEVKSKASKKEVADSIQKLNRIKQLKRYPSSSFRHYNSSHTTARFVFRMNDKEITFRRQIHTFMICEKFKIAAGTIASLLKQNCENIESYPNMFLSVEGDVFSYINMDSGVFTFTADYASHATMAKTEYAFNVLLLQLLRLTSIGETVPLNYEPYLGRKELRFDDEKIIQL